MIAAPLVGLGFLARDDIDEEVKHVGLRQRRSNVRTLQGASLILLSMDPSPHGQLGDEDIATLGKEDRSLSRDHLNIGIGLHNLLYPGQGELVHLVVVLVILEVMDGLLPVGCQDILVVPGETLMHIGPCASVEL